MTAEDNGYIIANLIAGVFLIPIGIFLVSNGLTGNLEGCREMATATYYIVALVVIVVVLGVWIDRRD